MKTRNYANEHSYFIPMIDAADIFKYSAAGTGLPLYKPYKKANGSSPMRADKDLFSSMFRFCLETAELECTYGSLKKGNFSQSVDDEIMLNGCTDALVCVTFDYAFREYNKFKWDSGRKGTLYVRAGYAYKDGVIIDQDGNKYEIADCACVCNHKLIAIITSSNTGRDNDERESVPVENNVLDSAASEYFDFDETDRQYVRKKLVRKNGNESHTKIYTEKSSNEIRDYLYLNGFDCLNKKGEPVHYVRYKRSAGMSRENKCIFIREDMLKKMMKWGTLTDRNPTTNRLLKKYKVSLNDDVVSAEAYGALSLSSLEDMLHLDISSILFMRDVKCEFQTKGMNVTADESGNISAEAKWSRVENNLFDGEALLDESVFEQAGRSNKGMMLLRNRYFKGCAFNTKIQQWFKDNDITSVDQLNGVTLANDISKVRMIVTESCLKFCKMLESESDDFESKIRFWAEWLGDDGCDFGIVKSEKPTPWLGGNLVRTSYQMLNTLCLDPGLVNMLMLPAAILKQRLRSDRNFFRYILSDFSEHSGEAEDTDDSIEYSSEKKQPDIYGYKDKLVCSLLDICPEFAETRMYQQFRSEWISKINDSIKRGKLLVHGTNAVLFGNGYEYLKTAINEGPKVKIIRIDQNQSSFFCPFFKDGQELMGIRSPHITMGNVLVLENRYNDEYRYFNLTNQIVCVNARNSNIQHILNGADYDSDTMLLTDNEMLIQGGKISKMQFPTPINKLSYNKATKSLTKIDIEIGKNKIGEIVNLSQKFNSILWAMVFQRDILPFPFSNEYAADKVYEYCAILEVLSNTEIDKAKRIYNVDADAELRKLQKIYREEYLPYFRVPDFYNYITKGTASRIKYDHRVYQCPMQYIYNRAFDDNVKRGKNGRPLSDIITDNSAGADIKTVNSIIKKAESVQNKRTALCARLHSNMYKIHNASVQNAISRETLSFFRSVRQEKLSPADILALINHIDEKGKDITEADWLLLAALCNSGHDDELDFSNTENTVIYSILKKNPPEADYDPDGIRKELYRMFGV